ncbi:hypothetical protein N7494_005375 [Penicillium frequentans]|uniref:Uncharacterized protein n=1 Tax=Penicillium frequentans TaxID=3151616 RepID=A0AAD6GHG2_9EURO|nr:hypothetical protein N7494_005375 [Penicillium glabrum]
MSRTPGRTRARPHNHAAWRLEDRAGDDRECGPRLSARYVMTLAPRLREIPSLATLHAAAWATGAGHFLRVWLHNSRLEPFRPWNPFQDKAQPSRDSLDICRYPVPVSITATSPPSDSSNSTSENTDVHPHISAQHPLPPRPPSEVCLRDSLPQEIDPQHQFYVEVQTSCVSPEIDALDFDDILQLQNLPDPGNEDHPMICHDLGLDSQYSLGFESYYPERACTTSQRSYVGNAGTYGLARECSDATIEPAILDDFHSRDIERDPHKK